MYSLILTFPLSFLLILLTNKATSTVVWSSKVLHFVGDNMVVVSALITSVGINSGLCVVFFVLYSVLRKQPSHYKVFVPRLLAQGTSKRRTRFSLGRFIPSPDWLAKAWNLSEDELLTSSGLDAVVFMRAITFCLKVFSCAGIMGIFILLPVNVMGTELHQFDFSDLSSISTDVFTISNINTGSKGLWIHFICVYVLTIFICYLLHNEYEDISSKRIAYFYSSEPQPHQFTILVHSIPVSPSCTVSDSVESFFTEYHPDTYLSHVVVRRTNKLRTLISNAKKLCKRIIYLESERSRQKGKYARLSGHEVDLVDQYEKQLEDIEQRVKLEQSEVLAAEDTRAAFVSFKSQYGAATASHFQLSVNPTHWLTEQAPEPRDVYWPFFSSSFMRRWISTLVVAVACILLTIFFLIPVVFVQGLANLSQLETWFPFLKTILTKTFLSQVITGYLPSLILMLFLKSVPPIMEFLSSIQGYISHSEIEKSACKKVLWFTIWNIFFATLFSGSAFKQISVILEPKDIPSKLAVAVPAQASFFIAYVVTSGWTSVLSELFRIVSLCFSVVAKCFSRSSDDEVEVPSMSYHKDIPRILFFGLLGITYFVLAPLILPFLLVYLCLAYIIFRNQFLNVYAPKYESGGKLWPIVHNSMIFSLVLMHAIAVGVFTLKKVSFASTLMFPLPVLTLLFNEYCRKRFLPIFSAYSAEVLIKKDRQEKNDDKMPEFFYKLVTAYNDPSLMPIRYSQSTESLNSPLI